MAKDDFDLVHQQVTGIIREVGAFLLDSYNKIDPVNSRAFAYSQDIRKQAEKKIIDYAKENKISAQLITELHGAVGKENATKWHIHALDGAVNFATKSPCFGIAIGVSIKNEVVYGAVFNPYVNEHTYAIKGNGAFTNNKQIKVSKQKTLSFCIGTTAPALSKRISKPILKIIEKGAAKKAFRISSFGAGVFHSTFVASGRREFWLSADGPLYDVCVPASLIILEAGGKVTNFEGKKWKVGDLTLLASNGYIHDALLSIIK